MNFMRKLVKIEFINLFICDLRLVWIIFENFKDKLLPNMWKNHDLLVKVWAKIEVMAARFMGLVLQNHT